MKTERKTHFEKVEHAHTRMEALIDDLLTVENGGVGVTVTVGDLDDGFYVADNGPGISEADRDAVFD